MKKKINHNVLQLNRIYTLFVKGLKSMGDIIYHFFGLIERLRLKWRREKDCRSLSFRLLCKRVFNIFRIVGTQG